MEISGFEAVTDMKSSAKHTRSRKQALPVPVPPVPMVSQETKDRLYAEVRAHPAFASMAVEDLRASIDYRMDAFLSQQPWLVRPHRWTGRSQYPAPCSPEETRSPKREGATEQRQREVQGNC